MKLRDEKKEYFHMRLSSQDKKLLEYNAARCNMTLSRYIQMWIDKALEPTKNLLQRGDLTYDDIETFFDNQLQFKRIFRNSVK